MFLTMIFNQEKFQFIFNLRTTGVTDSNVLIAMENIPRDIFIGKTFISHAFEDIALPIACGQTTTQPSVIGLMTQALKVNTRSKILEIGTGSGYQTAILAHLGRRVYSIERQPTLARTAKRTLDELSIANAIIICEDGTSGLKNQAPFDRIIVSAAVDDIPRILLSQLKPDGVLVAPVGRNDSLQTIIRVEKNKNRSSYMDLRKVRFLPIMEGKEDSRLNYYRN